MEDSGFTLVELLVVVALIGVLSGAVVVAINPAQRMAEARDAQRLSDTSAIVRTLDQYRTLNGRYPDRTADACCDGWDQGPCGSDQVFIQDLESREFFKKVPTDPKGGSGTGCYGYNYYRYPAGYAGCDSSKGAFYVFGVRDMESSSRPHPQSLGWSCPNRDWQNEFDWVIGGFENP